MGNLQEIRDNINQVPLKKVWFGGYSKEDVQMKMDMVYAMFEKVMKEQAEKEAGMLAEFETQLQALREEFESTKRVSDILIGDLNRNINDLNVQNKMLEQEHVKLQDAYAALTIERNEIKQEQVKAEEEKTVLIEEKGVLLEEKQKLLQEQVQMKEANDMLVAENEQKVKEQAQMKEAYKAYCGDLLKEYSDSLRALSGEFSRILENVSNMQKEIDEESVFEGLERAFEMKKREVLTGTVEETIDEPVVE